MKRNANSRRDKISRRRSERAVRELPDHYREVIILSVVQRVPTQEVAARLAMTVPAVCMLRSRALRKLRDVFGNTDSLRLPNRAFRDDEARGDPEPS